jgi:hypothetical protein
MQKGEGKQDVAVGPSMEVKVRLGDTGIMHRMRAFNEKQCSRAGNAVRCN